MMGMASAQEPIEQAACYTYQPMNQEEEVNCQACCQEEAAYM